MLHNTRRSLALVATTALAAGAMIAPAASSAKTVRVSVSIKQNLKKGGKISGTARGTFGTCPGSGTAIPPNSTLTLRCKGGTVTFIIKDAHLASGGVVGTFTLKGTGKYRKIKGRGDMKGTMSGNFTYKGRASY